MNKPSLHLWLVEILLLLLLLGMVWLESCGAHLMWPFRHL